MLGVGSVEREREKAERHVDTDMEYIRKITNERNSGNNLPVEWEDTETCQKSTTIKKGG